MYPAHIRRGKNNKGDNFFTSQSVKEHCRNTASYASEILSTIGLQKTAYLAGLLHDSGKCRSAFKNYIEDSIIRGKKVKRGTVDHSFVGMRYILSKHQNDDNIDAAMNITIELIAYAIGSHHGLFDCIKNHDESVFDIKIQKDDDGYKEAIRNYFDECAFEEELENLLQQATEELKKLIPMICELDTSQQNICEIPFYYALLCRLLTSAVIAGDRRDTIEFETNTASPYIKAEWDNVLKNFNAYISSLEDSSDVDYARKTISEACAKAAEKQAGIYRLRVPTGGGKTLSATRYALEHAKKYHKRMIFFVMPLLAIIEQNAKEIRKAVQDDSLILEHHSNVVNEEENEIDEINKRQLLVQSWDAPIIITTLVQFLNTLFAGKTSSIRRFSALVDSVIVFDEVQSVPNKMLTLFNLAVNFLVEICHATVVLCSATQPSFEKTEHKMIDEVEDLIRLPSKVLKVFERVEVLNEGFMTMEQLSSFALCIVGHGKSLLIVCNTKKEASDLFIDIDEKIRGEIPVYHLSASMCTAHRTKVVEAMKADLKRSKQIVCIATQVIEAGVDISFNSVIRLKAGMDNIIQAAGRCNRNGESKSKENVYIVSLLGEKLSRLPEIEQAKTATESLLQYANLNEDYDDLMSDAAINYYYRQLYSKMNKGYQDFKVDGSSIYEMLNLRDEVVPYFLSQKFKTAGSCFRVFDDQTKELLIPYKKGMEIIAELNSDKAKYDISYAVEKLKEATGYTVACYKYQLDSLEKNNVLDYNEDLGIYMLIDPAYYDSKMGLKLNSVGGNGFFE